ncbi:MAG: prolipoprotein diacylglyceryl transferase [Candidatus Absconditabacteria bacterium]|nr:prolipoprotein diacylglyceryl transferase [Candidatus Absconditabacteria bacterium]
MTFLFGYLFLLFVRKYSFFEKYAPNLYNLLNKDPEDIILYSVLGIIVGGRLGHIFIYDFAYYLESPLKVFAIWEGGMSFIGGIIGVLISLLFIFRKYGFSFRDLIVLTDLIILPVGFGVMLGRIGNFLNQELYGRLVSDVFTNISLSVVDILSHFNLFYVYDSIDGFLRINTNFLASFFEGFVVFVVSLVVLSVSIKKKKRKTGFLSSFFIVWYSFVRFFLEYLRMDSQSEYVAFFTKSQWFFVIFFLIGIFIMYRSLKSSRYIK